MPWGLPTDQAGTHHNLHSLQGTFVQTGSDLTDAAHLVYRRERVVYLGLSAAHTAPASKSSGRGHEDGGRKWAGRDCDAMRDQTCEQTAGRAARPLGYPVSSKLGCCPIPSPDGTRKRACPSRPTSRALRPLPLAAAAPLSLAHQLGRPRTTCSCGAQGDQSQRGGCSSRVGLGRRG